MSRFQRALGSYVRENEIHISSTLTLFETKLININEISPIFSLLMINSHRRNINVRQTPIHGSVSFNAMPDRVLSMFHTYSITHDLARLRCDSVVHAAATSWLRSTFFPRLLHDLRFSRVLRDRVVSSFRTS